MARAVPWHGGILIRTAIGWSSYKIPAPAGSERLECRVLIVFADRFLQDRRLTDFSFAIGPLRKLFRAGPQPEFSQPVNQVLGTKMDVAYNKNVSSNLQVVHF